MAGYTENYNLKKPDRTDFYSVQDFNDNADIIDAALDDKLNKDFSNISSGAGGAVPIANGGTGATTAAQALINLGVTANLNNKADKDLSNVTGTLPISNGGTGATTAAQALINLGVESNYKLLGVDGLLANQNVLSYIDSLEEPKCGFFWTNGCTNTPNDSLDWWYMNLSINSDRPTSNEGQKTLWAQIRANDVCEVWVNQKWYVNGSFTWCGWRKVLTAPQNTNVGVSYVTSSTPSTAQNNDLWAW